MKVRAITDRAQIEAFLRREAAAHVYALADLDDFFWPSTCWHAALDAEGRIAAVCLLLNKLDPPVLYAVCPPGHSATAALLQRLLPSLPRRFFADLGLGLEDLFQVRYTWDSAGEHVKMWLQEPAAVTVPDVPGLARLTAQNLEELTAFYRTAAYRADETAVRFFEPYMLQMGPYYGVRRGGALVCAGGVHVRSRRQRVAALGNIATRPDMRRRGLARAVTAAVCDELARDTDLIGLNVHVDNVAAMECYRGLGFVPVCPYVEGMFEQAG